MKEREWAWQIVMIEVFWAFPISVTATAGGPSWCILLCVCVCVYMGCVCVVPWCGNGDSAENICWSTTVATGIPWTIKKMSTIVWTRALHFLLFLLYRAASFDYFCEHSQNASQMADPGSDMLAIWWVDWIPGLSKALEGVWLTVRLAA